MTTTPSQRSDEQKAAQAPRHDLIEQAARFLLEHARHERFTFDDPQGRTGIYATCMQCCASIHYPFLPAPKWEEELFDCACAVDECVCRGPSYTKDSPCGACSGDVHIVYWPKSSDTSVVSAGDEDGFADAFDKAEWTSELDGARDVWRAAREYERARASSRGVACRECESDPWCNTHDGASQPVAAEQCPNHYTDGSRIFPNQRCCAAEQKDETADRCAECGELGRLYVQPEVRRMVHANRAHGRHHDFVSAEQATPATDQQTVAPFDVEKVAERIAAGIVRACREDRRDDDDLAELDGTPTPLFIALIADELRRAVTEGVK